MKIINLLVTTILLIIGISLNSYSQSKNVAGKKYKKVDNSWYLIGINDKGSLCDTNHVTVKIKADTKIEKINFEKIGIKGIKVAKDRFADGFNELILPPESDKFEILEKLEQSGYFEDISFNIYYITDSAPNDDLYGNQWNLPKVNMPAAWDITTGSSNIIVAVIDESFDYTHPDLAGNIWPGIGYDFYNDDSDVYPYEGSYHGTCVAGIIGARTNNVDGVAGIAGGWNGSGGIKLMLLKAGENGFLDNGDIADAIYYAIQNNAKVINMSFGSYNEMNNVATAINTAVSNGVICVAGSGNYYSGTGNFVMYPARYDNVIAVGATIQNDTRKVIQSSNDWGSSYGPQLDLTAPGLSIPTTDVVGTKGKDPGNYYNFAGTSSAAPMVSGLAALLISFQPSLTPQNVKSIMENSAVDLGTPGRDDVYGYGRIDAYNALYITQQVTTSGELSSNQVWFTTVNLTGNVTVPSGKTLTINSNAFVTLNGYTIRSTGGTINLDPSATVSGLRAKTTYSNALKGLYPTIQTAIELAQSGYEVEIQPGTYNESNFALSKPNLTISGAGEDYTSLTGTLTFNTCNNLSVKDITCRQVSVYYCSPCTLNCNIVGNFTQTGIEMYSSNIWNCFGNVNYCNTGLSASATSGIITGTNYAASYCNISASQSSNLEADNIWFCNPRTYDFIANTSSVIHSYSCHFLNGPLHSGNVFISGNMDCLSKMNSNADAGNDFTPMQIESDDPAEVEFSKVNNSYFSFLKKMKDIKESGSSDKAELYNQFQSIAKEFKAFIKKNPQSNLSRTALTTAANSYWLFSNTEDDKDANNNRQSFLNEIISDKELASLNGAVENLMIDYYIKAKDSDRALNAVNAFIEKYKNDEELLCEGLFKKGLILSYEMKQPEKAAECFAAILKDYSDNPLAGFAKTQLELSGNDIKENPEGSLAYDEKTFGADAYPNPFNPSTTIRFNLPEEGKIIVKIFDILGREVAVLLNEYMQVGSHNVVWSGKDAYGSEVASGVYFYNIRYNDQSLTKKMMLVR